MLNPMSLNFIQMCWMNLSDLWVSYSRGIPYIKKVPYSFIEPKIKPLVDAMNATGLIETIASCQGHGSPFGSANRPYVYFKTTNEFASLLQKTLLESDLCQERWILNGIFNKEYQLCFSLECIEYHEKVTSMFASFHFYFFRNKVDAELLSLVQVIDKTMLLYIRDKNENQITKNNN